MGAPYQKYGLPKRYKVILVRKRHYPLAVLLGDREEVLEDVLYTLSEFGAEVLEDEVGVLFGNSRRLVRPNVMPQCDIVQRKVNSRSVREVRNNHGV